MVNNLESISKGANLLKNVSIMQAVVSKVNKWDLMKLERQRTQSSKQISNLQNEKKIARSDKRLVSKINKTSRKHV